MWHTHITEKDYEDYSNITGQLADTCDMIQNMVSINIDDELVRKGRKHFVKNVLNVKKVETMINFLSKQLPKQEDWILVGVVVQVPRVEVSRIFHSR